MYNPELLWHPGTLRWHKKYKFIIREILLIILINLMHSILNLVPRYRFYKCVNVAKGIRFTKGHLEIIMRKLTNINLDPTKLLHTRFVLTISMDICSVTTSATLTLLNPLSSNACHQVRSFFTNHIYGFAMARSFGLALGMLFAEGLNILERNAE